MKTNSSRSQRFFLIMCLVTVAIAPRVETAAAQTHRPKTVADFLRLVPERYMIGYDLRFREELLRGERRGVVVDIRNGYISYDASDNPTGFELAIFRKSNGGYIVAYNRVSDNFNWEPGDGATLFLLSYEGGRWRDVSRVLMPVALDGRLGYTLPRWGRNIRVAGGREPYSLTWSRDRFHIKRASRK